MRYSLKFTKQASKDWKKIDKSLYRDKFMKYFKRLRDGDFSLEEFKQIDFKGCLAYSIRVNIQHRIVFRIENDNCYIIILKTWGHYDDNG